ncbi:MAG: hypothetical protein AAF355_07330 [Myxococcota bacterium]
MKSPLSISQGRSSSDSIETPSTAGHGKAEAECGLAQVIALG